MWKEKLALLAIDIASAGGGGSDSYGGGGSDSGSSSYSSDGSFSGGGSSSTDAAIVVAISVNYVLAGLIIYAGSKLRSTDRRSVTTMRAYTIICAATAIVITTVICGAVFESILSILFGVISCCWLWIPLVIEVCSDKLIKDIEQTVRQKQGTWEANIEGPLAAEVQQLFCRYQTDWGNLDASHFTEYMTPRYAAHATLMIEAFAAMGRRNPTVVTKYILAGFAAGSYYGREFNLPPRYDNNGQEISGFDAWINADVDDALVDMRRNVLLQDNKYTLNEKWVFVRVNGRLLLDGIRQPTEDPATRAGQIEAFAVQNNAFYSLDWGRMLLPQYGMIFTPTSFQVGDINNHVIGRFADTGHAIRDDVVYQLFTYSEVPYYKADKVYLVGELAVPKSYGNIAIIRKDGWLTKRPSGLQRFTFESSEFNNLYEVYASNGMAVATFELLNPAMIQTLAAAPFVINIEVTDNIIYFYAQLEKTDVSNYAAMLSILQTAYRELYL